MSGTIVTVLEKYEDGWWRVDANGSFGLYPSNYLEDINQVFDELCLAFSYHKCHFLF